MDRMSEKIGLYDLWTVFFPGTVGILGLLFFYHIYEINGDCSQLFINWKTPNTISDWALFILLSYFMGIILQEIGRILRKLLKSGDATKGLLKEENGVFTKREIRAFTQLYINHGYKGKSQLSKESKRLFHSINTSAQELKIADRYVKLNVLQNMSLSLSVNMLFDAVGLFVVAIYYLLRAHKQCECIITMILCALFILLFILFFERSERYNKYWVRNIVYGVYKFEEKKNSDRQ